MALDTEQIVFICVISFISLLTLLLAKSIVCKPFRLSAVLFHELGHALAATICCSKVTAIQINWQEGGDTRHKYAADTAKRVSCCVFPAGYLGSSWFGSLLILASSTARSSVITASLILASLCSFSCFMRNSILTLAAMIGCMVSLGITLILAFAGADPEAYACRVILLCLGSFVAVFAMFDVCDDTVRRYVKGSDAAMCAEQFCGDKDGDCCGKCVGIIWFFMSLAVFLGVSFASIYYFVDDDADLALEDWLWVVVAVILVLSVPIAVLFYCRSRGGSTSSGSGSASNIPNSMYDAASRRKRRSKRAWQLL